MARLLMLASLVVLAGPLMARSAVAGDDVARARAAGLEEEIRLAQTGDAYLVLDLGAGRIYLRRLGVDLFAAPVTASLGLPGWADGRDLRWPAVRFQLASPVTEPPRPVLVADGRANGDSSAASALSVDAIQAKREHFLRALPTSYQLRFDPGLEVEVRGLASSLTLVDHWRDARTALRNVRQTFASRSGAQPPRVRLRLDLAEADARLLYLALESGVALVVSWPADIPVSGSAAAVPGGS